ncbi:MAG: hypothetical protein ABIJ27_05270, partial [Candidatus Omnitrophota bacterium]
AERDVIDLEEEEYYREYSAKIGMGGEMFGEVLYSIEMEAAEKLNENSRAYIDERIDDQKYEENVLAIKRFRLAYRDLMKHYFLGTVEKVDISDLQIIKNDPTSTYATRFYGILHDMTLYMNEEEKREFLMGEELTRLEQKYDSIFEAMVEQYDGANFHRKYMNDTTVNLGLLLRNAADPTAMTHEKALKDMFDEFKTAEDRFWDDYEKDTNDSFNRYKGHLTYLISEFGTNKTKIDTFYEKTSWVPGGEDYAQFRELATPGATMVNPEAGALGEVVFGKMEEFMKIIGWNVYITWLMNNSLWRHFMTFDNVRQDAVDDMFYTMSNAQARVNQYLTAFTDTAGLTNESSRDDVWASYWMPYGPSKHMENYAYSDDEELRDAYKGYEIVDSLTKDMFVGDTDLELQIQRMLTSILGTNVGQYQYKEYGHELYRKNPFINPGDDPVDDRDIYYELSVVADDRYHSSTGEVYVGNGMYAPGGAPLLGTLEKKINGEINDKVFLTGEGSLAAGNTTFFTAANMTKPGIDSTTGNAITIYNTKVNKAIDDFNVRLKKDIIPAVKAMNLTARKWSVTAGGGIVPVAKPEVYGPKSSIGQDVLGKADIDYTELDLIKLMKENGLEDLRDAIYKAQNELTKKLAQVMISYTPGGFGTPGSGNNARQFVLRSSPGGREPAADSLTDDLFHFSNLQIDFFEDTVSTARRYMEEGLPGTTWADGLEGSIDGRRNLSIYAKRKFQQYYTPSFDEFTDDKTFDALESTGMSYTKLLGLHSLDSSGHITTQNRAFLSKADLDRGQAYEISDLVDGVTEQYMRAKDGQMELIKRFGDGSWRYQTDVISKLYAGEYVYGKQNNALLSDFRGSELAMINLRDAEGRLIPAQVYDPTDKKALNMREKQEYQGLPTVVRTWDDYKMMTNTTFAQSIYGENDRIWDEFSYSMTERLGYSLNNIYDKANLNPTNFGNIFELAYIYEQRRLEATGDLEAGEDALLSMSGRLSGIALDFGLFGRDSGGITSLIASPIPTSSALRSSLASGIGTLRNSQFKPTLQGDVSLRLKPIHGLTRFNARTRLRRAMDIANAGQAYGVVPADRAYIEAAYGRVSGIDVWWSEPFFNKLKGGLHAEVPGKVALSRLHEQINGVIHETGAPNIHAITKNGGIVFVNLRLHTNTVGGGLMAVYDGMITLRKGDLLLSTQLIFGDKSVFDVQMSKIEKFDRINDNDLRISANVDTNGDVHLSGDWKKAGQRLKEIAELFGDGQGHLTKALTISGITLPITFRDGKISVNATAILAASGKGGNLSAAKLTMLLNRLTSAMAAGGGEGDVPDFHIYAQDREGNVIYDNKQPVSAPEGSVAPDATDETGLTPGAVAALQRILDSVDGADNRAETVDRLTEVLNNLGFSEGSADIAGQLFNGAAGDGGMSLIDLQARLAPETATPNFGDIEYNIELTTGEGTVGDAPFQMERITDPIETAGLPENVRVFKPVPTGRLAGNIDPSVRILGTLGPHAADPEGDAGWVPLVAIAGMYSEEKGAGMKGDMAPGAETTVEPAPAAAAPASDVEGEDGGVLSSGFGKLVAGAVGYAIGLPLLGPALAGIMSGVIPSLPGGDAGGDEAPAVDVKEDADPFGEDLTPETVSRVMDEMIRKLFGQDAAEMFERYMAASGRPGETTGVRVPAGPAPSGIPGFDLGTLRPGVAPESEADISIPTAPESAGLTRAKDIAIDFLDGLKGKADKAYDGLLKYYNPKMTTARGQALPAANATTLEYRMDQVKNAETPSAVKEVLAEVSGMGEVSYVPTSGEGETIDLRQAAAPLLVQLEEIIASEGALAEASRAEPPTDRGDTPAAPTAEDAGEVPGKKKQDAQEADLTTPPTADDAVAPTLKSPDVPETTPPVANRVGLYQDLRDRWVAGDKNEKRAVLNELSGHVRNGDLVERDAVGAFASSKMNSDDRAFFAEAVIAGTEALGNTSMRSFTKERANRVARTITNFTIQNLEDGIDKSVDNIAGYFRESGASGMLKPQELINRLRSNLPSKDASIIASAPTGADGTEPTFDVLSSSSEEAGVALFMIDHEKVPGATVLEGALAEALSGEMPSLEAQGVIRSAMLLDRKETTRLVKSAISGRIERLAGSIEQRQANIAAAESLIDFLDNPSLETASEAVDDIKAKVASLAQREFAPVAEIPEAGETPVPELSVEDRGKLAAAEKMVDILTGETVNSFTFNRGEGNKVNSTITVNDMTGKATMKWDFPDLPESEDKVFEGNKIEGEGYTFVLDDGSSLHVDNQGKMVSHGDMFVDPTKVRVTVGANGELIVRATNETTPQMLESDIKIVVNGKVVFGGQLKDIVDKTIDVEVPEGTEIMIGKSSDIDTDAQGKVTAVRGDDIEILNPIMNTASGSAQARVDSLKERVDALKEMLDEAGASRKMHLGGAEGRLSSTERDLAGMSRWNPLTIGVRGNLRDTITAEKKALAKEQKAMKSFSAAGKNVESLLTKASNAKTPEKQEAILKEAIDAMKPIGEMRGARGSVNYAKFNQGLQKIDRVLGYAETTLEVTDAVIETGARFVLYGGVVYQVTPDGTSTVVTGQMSVKDFAKNTAMSVALAGLAKGISGAGRLAGRGAERLAPQAAKRLKDAFNATRGAAERQAVPIVGDFTVTITNEAQIPEVIKNLGSEDISIIAASINAITAVDDPEVNAALTQALTEEAETNENPQIASVAEVILRYQELMGTMPVDEAEVPAVDLNTLQPKEAAALIPEDAEQLKSEEKQTAQEADKPEAPQDVDATRETYEYKIQVLPSADDAMESTVGEPIAPESATPLTTKPPAAPTTEPAATSTPPAAGEPAAEEPVTTAQPVIGEPIVSTSVETTKATAEKPAGVKSTTTIRTPEGKLISTAETTIIPNTDGTATITVTTTTEAADGGAPEVSIEVIRLPASVKIVSVTGIETTPIVDAAGEPAGTVTRVVVTNDKGERVMITINKPITPTGAVSPAPAEEVT